MSAPQWKPGDVAEVACNGERMLAIRGRGIFHADWYTAGPVLGSRTSVLDSAVSDVRPLVVIDPEDGETVTRLTREIYKAAPLQGSPELYDAMRAALRSLVAPVRPPVYSHLRSSVSPDGISVALCGKVWRAGVDVLVVAECPNCRDLAEEWVA